MKFRRMDIHEVRKWIQEDTVSQHQNELLAMVQRHPDATRKNLHLATAIRVNKFRNGLIVILSDGKEESFSIVKYFQGTVTPMRTVVLEALRNTVDSQTHGFRIANGFRHKGNEYHVGHVGEHEFKDIVNAFIRAHSLQLETIAVRKTQLRPGLDYTSYVLADEHLARTWQAFHEQHCSLKMQTPEENYAFSCRDSTRPKNPSG